MASTSTYQATDAIISPDFSIYTPSVSRVRDPVDAVEQSRVMSNGYPHAPTELDALLGGTKSSKKPFYRPRPLWCVLASLYTLPFP